MLDDKGIQKEGVKGTFRRDGTKEAGHRDATIRERIHRSHIGTDVVCEDQILCWCNAWIYVLKTIDLTANEQNSMIDA